MCATVLLLRSFLLLLIDPLPTSHLLYCSPRSEMAPDKLWSEKGKMDSEGPIMQVQPQQYPDDCYDVDYEKHGASRESNPLPDLKRKLKSRHLQMIAIGE